MPASILRADERAALAAEQAGRLREAFDLYVSALQALPDPPPAEGDLRLRERIVSLARRLSPPPALPEDAKRYVTYGLTAFKQAKTNEDFEKAAAEFRKAVRAAPWHPPALFNLAAVEERLSRWEEAMSNLRLYLLAASEAPNVAQVRAKIYELEYNAKELSERLRRYQQGEVPEDPAEARRLYEQACHTGVGRGCADLMAAETASGGQVTPERIQRMAAVLRRGCDAGDALACLFLAGTQTSPDSEKALQRSCDARLAMACGLLGDAHYAGGGAMFPQIGKDAQRARDYYARAVEYGQQSCATPAGSRFDCLSLAVAYLGTVYYKVESFGIVVTRPAPLFGRGFARTRPPGSLCSRRSVATTERTLLPPVPGSAHASI